MESFRVLLLLFSFCIYLSLLSTQARFHHHHHHKKHKHNNHPVSQISHPPSSSSPFPSPDPSDPDQQPPSSSTPSPSPAHDDPDQQPPPPYSASPSPAPSDPHQKPPSSPSSHSPPPSDPYQKPPSSASHSPPPSDPYQQPPSSSNSPSPAPSDPYQQPPSSSSSSHSPPPYQKPPSSSASPSPAPSEPDDNYYNSSTIFDVRKFGAVGNGVTDDTDAFKSAWEAACEVESGVLFVPSHHTFMIQSTIFTGPCQPGFMFQVEGTIWPPDGPESWPEKNSKRQWLVFYRINNMTLQGTGLIDGRGEQWWNLPCKPHRGPHGTTLPGPCDSPIAVRFYMSNNLTVQGLKIKDSPQFHFRFDSCRNVHINSINITAPPLSPNTDGIHIENSNNVQIYNSIISNGDDCVSIGSGCYDVDVKNITCEHGHGISIGSLGNHNSRACVSNITVRESSLKQSDNGVRIKTWQGGSGAVSGVTFENIHMDNVKNPIIIDQFYCLSRECSNRTSAVLISDIEYTNIKGTYNVRNPPMHLACSDSVPCTNITFSDVELLPAQGDLVLDPYCWNVYGELATVTIPPVSCLLEGNPKTILESSLGYC